MRNRLPAGRPQGAALAERAQEDRAELRVAEEVAPGETARIGGEPEEPLEPSVRHPPRRAPLGAGDEVEPGPHRDEDRGLEDGAHLLRPALALRARERDEDHVRPGLADP